MNAGEKAMGCIGVQRFDFRVIKVVVEHLFKCCDAVIAERCIGEEAPVLAHSAFGRELDAASEASVHVGAQEGSDVVEGPGGDELVFVFHGVAGGFEAVGGACEDVARFEVKEAFGFGGFEVAAVDKVVSVGFAVGDRARKVDAVDGVVVRDHDASRGRLSG